MVEKKAQTKVFGKTEILASQKYAERKDLLCALLSDGENYTLNEVDKKIENYMKGAVK